MSGQVEGGAAVAQELYRDEVAEGFAAEGQAKGAAVGGSAAGDPAVGNRRANSPAGLHVVEDQRAEKTAGFQTSASAAPEPDAAPAITVHGSLAYDLDSTGPLPDVSGDLETMEAAERLRGRVCYRALKRAFDVAFSALVLVLLSWLFLIIAVAIKLDDPSGPVFFRQKRVGRLGGDGRPSEFGMYKFRSMVPDAEERLGELRALNEKTGPVFKIREDPRVTRVGRLLRKTSLAPVIIGTPGDGEPTKSLSYPENSSLDLQKCERRPGTSLGAHHHYTSLQFLSFTVFGGPEGTSGWSLCAFAQVPFASVGTAA